MIKNKIRSGFSELDKILMSFESGKVYILGARPGMGKTSFMTDMALNIAKQIPVHIFLLDEPIPTYESMFKMASKKWITVFEFKDLSKSLLKLLRNKDKNFDNLPIYIHNKSVTVKEINEMKITDGIIFIDCLQLLKLKTEKKSIFHSDSKDKILKELKALAKKNNVPIVVLSNLNRTADKRGIKGLAPKFCDIRFVSKRNIFKYVDAVIFLYRKAYYNVSIGSDEAELTVIKKYIGRTGTAILHFDNKNRRFF